MRRASCSVKHLHTSCYMLYIYILYIQLMLTVLAPSPVGQWDVSVSVLWSWLDEWLYLSHMHWGWVYSSTVSTHFKQTLSALTMSQEQLISWQNEQIVATKLGEALAPRPLITVTSSPIPKFKMNPSNKRGSASQDGPAAKRPRLVPFRLLVYYDECDV